MIAPARMAAFDALLAWEKRGADLPGCLAAARRALDDPRDQALLTELVNGTVRMRLALDYQIGLRARRPLAGFDVEVLVALRLGACQLLYLDRLPAAAVVNDAVSLVRRSGKTSAGALVNAVLRALARERRSLAWPEGDDAAALAIRESHPEWLVRRWIDRYGVAATRAWLAFDNQSPALCLAVNPARGTRQELAERLRAEGVETRPTARSPLGLHVERGSALTTAAFRDGWCVVQDEASQLVVAGLDVRPGRRVLDLCAAPGGKTVTIAARAAPGGRVVACDVRPRRVRLLRQTLARTAAQGTSVACVDPDAELPFVDDAFDLVFVDAPCSGLGTLRRDPDIRWTRQEADLPRLASRQLGLLGRASRLVRPGGALVYATCSSEPDENEQVVSAFLSSRDDFVKVHEHRTTPPDDGLEAFYAATLTRKL